MGHCQWAGVGFTVRSPAYTPFNDSYATVVRTPNRKDAEGRIRRSIACFFLQFREDFDAFGLGDGDRSLPGGVWIQLVLGDVELLYVRGTERHVVLRRQWGGGAYDVDLYADFHSSNAKVRVARAGELYPDLEQVGADVLTDAEFEHLLGVLQQTGECGYAELVPTLEQLRARGAIARKRFC